MRIQWIAVSCVLLLAGQSRGQTTPAAARPFANIPHFSLGGGVLSYRETEFELAPSLHSKFEEPVFDVDLGWDFVFQGHHAVTLGLGFLQSMTGTERWHEFGSLVQENDLDVGLLRFNLGYLASTWDRSRPPAELEGPARMIRFAGGARFFYHWQRFLRDEFVDFSESPPVMIDSEVQEDFHRIGGEVVLELEVGPRHIVAGFLRGQGGGGWVGVLNDSLEPVVDKDEILVNTTGVHGTIEVGVVSQPTPAFEVRIGYRYQHLAVFGDRADFSGVDPILGPVEITVELPDNTTEIHLGFVQFVFPF